MGGKECLILFTLVELGLGVKGLLFQVFHLQNL